MAHQCGHGSRQDEREHVISMLGLDASVRCAALRQTSDAKPGPAGCCDCGSTVLVHQGGLRAEAVVNVLRSGCVPHRLRCLFCYQGEQNAVSADLQVILHRGCLLCNWQS